MPRQYPSQNRVRLPPVAPGYDEVAKQLATQWTAETGRRWSVKDVLESLLTLAIEGGVKPVIGAKKVE